MKRYFGRGGTVSGSGIFSTVGVVNKCAYRMEGSEREGARDTPTARPPPIRPHPHTTRDKQSLSSTSECPPTLPLNLLPDRLHSPGIRRGNSRREI
jgi:hypothetical protein